MAKITNTGKSPLGIPGETKLLAPKASIDNVSNDRVRSLRGNRVFKAWEKRNLLTIDGYDDTASAVEKARTEGDENAEKDALIVRLNDEFGVKVDRRKSVETLRELVAEHEAARGSQATAPAGEEGSISNRPAAE